ncbi:hypothetical protein MJO29_016719, partial [Puccinia striiformis f. sp. tritici]
TRRFYVISSMEGEDRLPLLARNTSLMEFEDDPKHGEYVLRHVSQRRELFIAPIALYGIHPPMARTLAEEWYGSRVRGVFMSTISKTMCNRNCYNVHLHSETISSFEFGMYAGKQGFRRRRESQQRSNIAGASAVEYCRTHRSASVWNFVAVPMRHEHRLTVNCFSVGRQSHFPEINHPKASICVDIGHWAGSSPASSPVGGRNFQPGLPSRVISITLKITPTIWLGLVGSEVPQRLNFLSREVNVVVVGRQPTHKEVALACIGRRNRKQMCHSFNSNIRQLESESNFTLHEDCKSCVSIYYLESKASLGELINRRKKDRDDSHQILRGSLALKIALSYFRALCRILCTIIINPLATALRASVMNPQTKSASTNSTMTLLFLLLWVTLNLGACEAYLSGGPGEPCVGTIHLHTNTSSSLTLIRDKRWAFYTDNSNSQYHIAPSRSFSLIARDLCRIVFASPMWRNTCLANKDEEANKKCLQMASVLHERAFIEPSKTAELWNRAFTFFNHSSTPDSLINQSR